MFKELEEKINEEIKKINLSVDSIYISNEENLKNLNICLDSNEIIDVEKITEATKIINPIIDKTDIIEKENIDVVDVHSKEKGDEKSEQ